MVIIKEGLLVRKKYRLYIEAWSLLFNIHIFLFPTNNFRYFSLSRYLDWEEFAKVGVNLLERLESFLEPINDDLNDMGSEGDNEDHTRLDTEY